jgi:AsmA protein
MGKTVKILGIIFIVVLVIIAGLSLFVHLYLTDERLRTLLLPPLEEALGRQVAITGMDVSLLHGITIRDLLVKEADGKTDFLRTKAFVLHYDLLPLLQKKLLISEIMIEEPFVRIVRTKNGTFNFDTLALMQKSEAPQTRKEQGGAEAVLPLALTINRIRLQQADVVFYDELGELPDAQAWADMDVAVSMAPDMAALRYSGDLTMKVAMDYGQLKPYLNGKAVFDQDRIDLTMDADVNKETVKMKASINQYRTSPDIGLDLTGDTVNVDHLLALAAAVPQHESKTTTPAPAAPATAPAAALPPDLHAAGQIRIAKALYKEVTISNVALRYELARGILRIQDLSAQSMGGRASSNLTVDLNKPDLSYTGDIGVQNMQAAEFSSAFAQKAGNIISGSLQSSLDFSGSGTQWSTIRRTLTGSGSFSLTDGRISNTPIADAVAGLLNLPELRDITFRKISGDFQIVKGGKVELDSSLDGEVIKAETKGTIGLDGALDLPVTLHLSPALSKKVAQTASLARYLADERGETVLHLKLVGTATKPRPTLDVAGVQQQVEKAIKDKAMETIEKSLSGEQKDGSRTPVEPQQLLKKLFK